MAQFFPRNDQATITKIESAITSPAPTSPDEAPDYNEREFLEFLVEMVTETGGAARENGANGKTFDTIFDQATSATPPPPPAA